MHLHDHHRPLSSPLGLQSSASSSTETDLSREANTWNKILDLSDHYVEGKLLRKFWSWNGATSISGTYHFSLPLAQVRRSLAWPFLSSDTRNTYRVLRRCGLVERLPGRCAGFVPVHPLAKLRPLTGPLPSRDLADRRPRRDLVALLLVSAFRLRPRLWSHRDVSFVSLAFC